LGLPDDARGDFEKIVARHMEATAANVETAVKTSVTAVVKNPKVMGVWCVVRRPFNEATSVGSRALASELCLDLAGF
jgi:hypothetical protein